MWAEKTCAWEARSVLEGSKLDDLVDGFQDGEYNTLRKDLKAFLWIPQVRVLDDGLIIFDATEAPKLQARVTRESLEKLAGDERHTVAALPQFLSNADERVYIASATDGAQENI